MFRIIDTRGSGKTGRLMLLAKEKNGILACANPYAMTSKAHAYGLTGFDIISYQQLISGDYNPDKKDVFIDEIDVFLRSLNLSITGYSLTNED